MKLEGKDWLKLRPTLITLGLIVVVVASLGVFGFRYSLAQEELLKKQKETFDSTKQRYQSSGAEKEMLVTYLPQYQQLLDKGLIGEERRIEWVDELYQQQKNLKLFGIKYDIGQQTEVHAPPYLPVLGSFTLFKSTMKIDFDLLHEEDVLKLTETLAMQNDEPFLLRDCTLVRLNQAHAWGKITPNMHATCEIDWLTLHEPLHAGVTR